MQENSEFFYHILPNNLKIAHHSLQSPVSYVGLMVGAGTRDEHAQENGIAHYIEHCVFKGTVRHTASQIIRNIEGTGGEVNAYTTKEETTFYAATLTEHLAMTLRLILEMVFTPTFPKEETDKERAVILDEIETYNDSPSELIYDDFEALVFNGHSLAMPILGTRKSLRHISSKPDIALQWMQNHYHTDRMVIFYEGNMRAEQFVRLVERELSHLPVPLSYSTEYNFSHSRLPITDTIATPHTASYRRHTHQVHVMLGQRAFPLGHELQLPLYLLNNILGGGSLNARLNMALREKEGLVYTIDSTYTPFSDTGYWATYFACDPDEVQHCLNLVYGELKKMIDAPLSESQLHSALNQLRGQMAIAAENRENSALAMAKSVLHRGYAQSWQQVFAQIASTTPDILQAAAQAVLEPSALFLLKYE